MKIFVLVLASTINISLFAQSADSLKKYSYLLVAVKNDKPIGVATCFFILKKQKLFLVTNYHVFTFWNTFKGGRIIPYADTLLLRLNRKDNDKVEFLPINIQKVIDTSKMQFYYDKPDLYQYEIKEQIKKTYVINYLNNDVVSNPYTDKLTNRIFYYGYHPTTLKHTSDLVTLNPELIQGSLIGNISQYWYYDEIKKLDTLNYEITHLSQILIGGSGSPIFFNYNRQYFFAGVMCGAKDYSDTLIIVRPERVSKFLK